MTRFPLWAFAALFAALAFSVSAQDKKDQKAGGPPAMPVRAVPVKVGTVVNDISAVGSLIANESVVIRPEVAGRIKAIQFDEGQAVAKGAKLVLLDTSEVDAQLADPDLGHVGTIAYVYTSVHRPNGARSRRLATLRP